MKNNKKSVLDNSAKNNIQQPIQTVAIEDLITVVCEYFCENIFHLHKCVTPKLSGLSVNNMIDWYINRSEKEKRRISEKLIDIIQKDAKNIEEKKK